MPHTIDTKRLIHDTEQLQTILSDSRVFQDSKTIATLYGSLVDVLIDHNHFYYLENKSIITDKEYDQLFEYLTTIESLYPNIIRQDSPSQKLSGQEVIQDGFEKSHHSSPILSLQNTYNNPEIMDWYESIHKILQKKLEQKTTGDLLGDEELEELRFFVEPKYDGLAIVLTYTDGKLTKAVTRGDGYTGDDVTENAKTIKNLPLYIPSLSKTKEGSFVVRGEILMPKSVRKRLNVQRKNNGEEPFSNTRNAAAGSLKLLNTAEVAKRGLVCYVYDVIEGDENILDHFPKHESHLPVGAISGKEVLEIIQSQDTQKNLLESDLDFDGLVIKIADSNQRSMLGSTNHHPRRAIAYKFPAQQIATQIISIDWQVGRTGIFTPVAHLTPKVLSGVTISRVSLHNRDVIQSKDIRLYDRVRLQRSGEVIPYIVAVITDRRTGNEKKISSDDIVCPACGSHAIKQENQVGTKSKPELSTQIFCPNDQCPGILKEQLKHFVSKHGMNITSIGDSMIDLIVDQRLVQSLADLYTLTQSEKVFLLKRMPGLATKKIDVLCDELEKSKHNELWRFINALGIPGIGIKLAKEIEKAILVGHLFEQGGGKSEGDVLRIFRIISSPDFLGSIYGIGETIIQEINKWIDNPKHIQLLTQFEHYNIQAQISDKHIQGTKSISITGIFPISRGELEFYITQAGYIFSAIPNKTTHYLFLGEKAGNKKSKIGPDTEIISERSRICTMLNISVPLFDKDITQEKIQEPSKKEMQSLF